MAWHGSRGSACSLLLLWGNHFHMLTLKLTLTAEIVQESIRVHSKGVPAHVKIARHKPSAGEPSKTAVSQNHEANTIPCPERWSTSGNAVLKSTPSLLCKRQAAVYFWQGHPAWNVAKAISQGEEPKKRDEKKPVLNWNAFGLRYGKRQAVKGKMKP
ncbi:hypothetical protein lerEdw1_018391 [Lerista edwardsae]|nr:hypothetical protein lerEdw1_018391 [Lerista edwardsae]